MNGVREEVVDVVQRDVDKCVFYFVGWNGNGATAFLSYMARVLPSMNNRPRGRLRFGRIIYLDCSKWKSKRAMQRKLAEELKLDSKTMAMFEVQDEEDDFNGVEHASRDVIRNVAVEIDRTLRQSRYMLIFINGSDDEVILSPFGIPESHDHVIIWTFRRSGMFSRVRHTNIILQYPWSLMYLTQLSDLAYEEAATISGLQDMDRAMAIDCLLYWSFLTTRGTTHRFLWRKQDHSVYWICDGVIQGDRSREIGNAFHPTDSHGDDSIVSFLSLQTRTTTPYLIFEGDVEALLDKHKKRPYRWITIKLKNDITSKNNKEETSTEINNSLVDKTELEVLDLSGNSHMKTLPTGLSKTSRLQELILDGCVGLEEVELANSSLKSFSFDGSKHVDDADKQYVKISKISLEGCTQLEKLTLCGLPNLVELDLSGCAIKTLDLRTMVKDVPRLKRLFLLGCEHLAAVLNFWGLVCLDTRPVRMLGCTRPSIAQHKHFQVEVHAIIADARLARSLCSLVKNAFSSRGVYFNINITSSTAQPEATSKEAIESTSDDQRHYVVPSLYGDVFSEISDALIPMQAFPQPPSLQSDRHIEIGGGSCNMQSEVLDIYNDQNLGELLANYTESLHVHDALARTIMPSKELRFLRWCRAERCPNVDVIFPSGAKEYGNALETIWTSDLLKACCIWSKGLHSFHKKYSGYMNFKSLRHLHLRSCPSIEYALPLWRPSFPSLEALHIIHCGSLRHVFEQDEDEEHQSSVLFPNLITICLHDLPALRLICEDAETLAPALETIKIKGCWSLRRLPALKGREIDVKKPAMEVEKDVWDALEWDGVDAGHHPSLYEAPVHSHYYRQSRLLRGTVLR
ncbi:unnamed protein product [Urochloa decumbens]|uniref:Disease resistance protein At4g27190-like leucine-rich repeats domain-containing protein n=1 Tax=Urochloa decumbens TaxID=240449 RepID=A0ABC9BVE6_9POAL